MSRKLLTGADLNNQRLINLADGTSPTDAATKQQLDAAIRGISWKGVARAASTAQVSLTAPGASIDGVTLASGDRVLLRAQTAGAENGLYVWTGASATMSRALDANTAAGLTGAAVYVSEGTTNADKAFTQTVDPITLGTTALTWTQLGGGNAYTAGNGLLLTGSAFSVVADPVTGGGILVTSAGVKIDTSIVVRKYAVDVGNGSLTTITVTHNLGTLDVDYTLYEKATGIVVDADVVIATTNTVTITFATAPTSAQYRCVVAG